MDTYMYNTWKCIFCDLVTGEIITEEFDSPWFLNRFVRKLKKDKSVQIMYYDTCEFE